MEVTAEDRILAFAESVVGLIIPPSFTASNLNKAIITSTIDLTLMLVRRHPEIVGMMDSTLGKGNTRNYIYQIIDDFVKVMGEAEEYSKNIEDCPSNPEKDILHSENFYRFMQPCDYCGVAFPI